MQAIYLKKAIDTYSHVCIVVSTDGAGHLAHRKEAKMSTVEQVKLELSELKRLGVPVSDKAFAYCDRNADQIEEDREGGMRISEIADLVRDLAAL